MERDALANRPGMIVLTAGASERVAGLENAAGFLHSGAGRCMTFVDP